MGGRADRRARVSKRRCVCVFVCVCARARACVCCACMRAREFMCKSILFSWLCLSLAGVSVGVGLFLERPHNALNSPHAQYTCKHSSTRVSIPAHV